MITSEVLDVPVQKLSEFFNILQGKRNENIISRL